MYFWPVRDDKMRVYLYIYIIIYINIHIHVIFDIWFLIFDLWFMTFDIWFMIFDWYTVYDAWYMIYDIRYLSQSGTPAIHIKTCCVVWWFESTTLSSTNIAHLPTRKIILQTFHRRRCVDHFDGRVHQKRSRIHGDFPSQSQSCGAIGRTSSDWLSLVVLLNDRLYYPNCIGTKNDPFFEDP